MNVSAVNALVTGASGGIGSAIAREIARCGGTVLMTGRDANALHALVSELDPDRTGTIGMIVANIATERDRRMLCDAASRWNGGINTLINNAGVAAFGMFGEASSEAIQQAFTVNTLAPLQLCRDLLPHLARQPSAHIVNIGSVFGSIGYPGHAIYSATKFALRGFSEALRRELHGTSVRIHYLAPRATRTKFNSPTLEALNERLRVSTDSPERVAASLLRMLERESAEQVIGWPEKLFAKINAVLPRLVDRALVSQTQAIRESSNARHAAEMSFRHPIQERTP